MRLLADLHISPTTVEYLRTLGHDVVRVSDVLPANAEDEVIVARAVADGRIILTQDLDFSALVALSGEKRPSVVSLRLSTARVEVVNETLDRVLPMIEESLAGGAVVSVEDSRVRVRPLPLQ